MSDLVWGPQQANALDAIGTWLKSDQQVFRLYGYAGTGKTTLARHAAALQDGMVLFLAYTGKAASTLAEKGCPNPSTIHRVLYYANIDLRAQQLEHEIGILWATGGDDESANPYIERITALTEELDQLRASSRGPSFRLNEDSIVREAPLVVLDECSMVDERVGEDLLSFGTKVLVMGDPAQLPPVGGEGFFTKDDPDILLTEIHRQALDNPIIRFATAARTGARIPLGTFTHETGSARKIEAADLTSDYYVGDEVGQILCGTNKGRQALNRKVRRLNGHLDRYPVPTDRLVCLRNDRKWKVFNGVTCTAVGDTLDNRHRQIVFLHINYEGRDLKQVPALRIPFDNTYEDKQRDIPYEQSYLSFDYGYALTVHKAQGSQWDRVTLVDDGWGRQDGLAKRRWLYTGITRAAKHLTLAV